MALLATHNVDLNSVCFIEVKGDNSIWLSTNSKTLMKSLTENDDFEAVEENRPYLRSLIFGGRIKKTTGNKTLMPFS